MNLLRAGGIHGPILLEDARDIVDIEEAMRRTIPRRLWVDEYREQDEDAAINRLL